MTHDEQHRREAAWRLVRRIADCNWDGEELEDGFVYYLENDEAHDWMTRIIHEARRITRPTVGLR